MALISEVRERLCGSPFIDREDSITDELRDYLARAIQLWNELKVAEPPQPAVPTNEAFRLHCRVYRELWSLIKKIELALAVGEAKSPKEICKVIYEAEGWPLDELNSMSREQLGVAQREILMIGGLEVGLLVGSLATTSRFFEDFISREKTLSSGRKRAEKTNAKRAKRRPDYHSAVQEQMSANDIKYIP